MCTISTGEKPPIRTSGKPPMGPVKNHRCILIVVRKYCKKPKRYARKTQPRTPDAPLVRAEDSSEPFEEGYWWPSVARVCGRGSPHDRPRLVRVLHLWFAGYLRASGVRADSLLAQTQGRGPNKTQSYPGKPPVTTCCYPSSGVTHAETGTTRYIALYTRLDRYPMADQNRVQQEQTNPP